MKGKYKRMKQEINYLIIEQYNHCNQLEELEDKIEALQKFEVETVNDRTVMKLEDRVEKLEKIYNAIFDHPKKESEEDEFKAAQKKNTQIYSGVSRVKLKKEDN